MIDAQPTILFLAYLAYLILFVTCAVYDICVFRIPNALVLCLLMLWLPVIAWFAFRTPGVDAPYVLLRHVLPSVVVFVIAATLFYFNQLGGGDVKLLAVTFLWLGFSVIPVFLILLGLFGIAAIVLFNRFPQALEWLILSLGAAIGRRIPIPRSLSAERHLPYGFVISASALAVGTHLADTAADLKAPAESRPNAPNGLGTDHKFCCRSTGQMESYAGRTI